jgi:hypothetical protein
VNKKYTNIQPRAPPRRSTRPHSKQQFWNWIMTIFYDAWDRKLKRFIFLSNYLYCHDIFKYFPVSKTLFMEYDRISYERNIVIHITQPFSKSSPTYSEHRGRWTSNSLCRSDIWILNRKLRNWEHDRGKMLKYVSVCRSCFKTVSNSFFSFLEEWLAQMSIYPPFQRSRRIGYFW